MEEDIEIIEEMIEVYRSCSVDEEGFDMRVDIAFMKKECKALENLLTRYKELEEKNKTQLEAFELGKESLRKRIEYDYIAKSKVKEKIEEYQKTEKEMHENKNHSNDINEIYKYAVEEDKAKYGAIVLQDLLERSREDVR